MALAWDQFTPLGSLVGGLLIGSAATLFIVGSGRIAGISTLIASPLRTVMRRGAWAPERTRLLFLLGLCAAPWVWQLAAPLPAARAVAGTPTLVVAGLLVGIGTRMGSGCTSGHGVCGLSRLSPRSLVNVLAFMGAGMASVFVMRHLV